MVLIVGEEDRVREVLRRCLVRAGVDAAFASSADDARGVLLANRGKISALVTGRDLGALFDEFFHDNPGARLILAGNVQPRNAHSRVIRLSVPYQLDALLAAIQPACD